jgi:hypothetical protein
MNELTPAALRKRRVFGHLPVFHRIGRSIRYATADVEQAIASQHVRCA